MYPTGPFTILYHKNQEICEFCAVQERRATVFEASKLWKGRSGQGWKNSMTWWPRAIHLLLFFIIIMVFKVSRLKNANFYFTLAYSAGKSRRKQVIPLTKRYTNANLPNPSINKSCVAQKRRSTDFYGSEIVKDSVGALLRKSGFISYDPHKIKRLHYQLSAVSVCNRGKGEKNIYIISFLPSFRQLLSP